VWSTRLGERRVIGTSDCLWGLLDGMNDAGLAVSLTFGGRQVTGDGFGIPIVVRYLLETCDDVAAARAALVRLPYSLAHNLTLVDAAGEVLTAYLSPDREPIFRAFPAATNHQGIVEWPEQARATRTVERERCIVELLQDAETTVEAFEDAFLCAPLFSTAYANGFGTLYTAAYRPTEGWLDLRWPTSSWRLGFEAFEEAEHTEVLAEGSVA
jgi:predicted choloylglycine hydrolase